jgi:hypothetical protein
MKVSRRTIFGMALLLSIAVGAGPTAPVQAGTVTTSVLGLFPRNVGEMGYADMKTARQYPWYEQLKGQLLPSRFRQFEMFLSNAGIDPEKQVDELVWAAAMPSSQSASATDSSGGDSGQAPQPTGEQVVGIALGNFSPESTEKYFQGQKLPTIKVRGYTLLGFGSGADGRDIFFFFVDSNTLAFGHRSLLEKLIGVRFGEEESFLRNEALFPLVDEVNGQATMWLALDQGYSRIAVVQLVAEAAQFPGADQLLSRIKAMTVTVQADHGMDARITPVCGSPDDANTLAQLLQAGLLYKRVLQGQDNPDLAKVIDSTTVVAEGDRLKVRIQLSEDLLAALLKRNSFAVRM